MARGNKKQGKALNVLTRDDTPLPKKSTAPFVAENEPVVMGLAEKYHDDEKAMASIYSFTDIVDKYAGKYNSQYKSSAVRELRQKVSDSFKKLPEDIQQYIEADRTIMSNLFRGASHLTNPGPDGTVNASFTTDRAHAESFVEAQSQIYDAGYIEHKYPSKGFRVYDANDVQGFDRIIDISKALKLKAAYELYGYRKRNNDPSLTSNRMIKDEKEFLVTNIRWKR